MRFQRAVAALFLIMGLVSCQRGRIGGDEAPKEKAGAMTPDDTREFINLTEKAMDAADRVNAAQEAEYSRLSIERAKLDAEAARQAADRAAKTQEQRGIVGAIMLLQARRSLCVAGRKLVLQTPRGADRKDYEKSYLACVSEAAKEQDMLAAALKRLTDAEPQNSR